MAKFHLIITGGRDYEDEARVRRILDAGSGAAVILRIAHGHCLTGADAFADKWALDNGFVPDLNLFRYPADWDLGKVAGPLRNQAMLDREIAAADAAKHTLRVLAFPGNRGTTDMVKRAGRAGVPITRL